MAFCSKCGSKITDNAKFCPSCGAAVNSQMENPQQGTESSFSSGYKKSEGKLLYESKGGQPARVAAIMLLSMLLAFSGVFIVCVAGSQDLQRKLLGGWFEDPTGVFAFGAALFVFGAIFIDVAIGMALCWLKIYDNRIEAQTMSLGFNKNYIQIPDYQIESVQLQGYLICVVSGGRKRRLICKDTAQAYKLIMDMISNRPRGQ